MYIISMITTTHKGSTHEHMMVRSVLNVSCVRIHQVCIATSKTTCSPTLGRGPSSAFYVASLSDKRPSLHVTVPSVIKVYLACCCVVKVLLLNTTIITRIIYIAPKLCSKVRQSSSYVPVKRCTSVSFVTRHLRMRAACRTMC